MTQIKSKSIHFLVLICILLTGSFSTVHAESDSRKQTISVYGEANIEIPTAFTIITFAVEVEEDSAERAHEEVAEKSSDLVALLKKKKPEKLETTGINLRAIYSNSKSIGSSGRQIEGYVASNQVMIKIKTEIAGEVIDLAVKNGANRISGLRFVAQDDVLIKAREKALKLAALDARQKADSVLEALGLKRKSIREISVNHSTPSPVASNAMMQKEAARTTIEGGDQTVTARVSLVIEY